MTLRLFFKPRNNELYINLKSLLNSFTEDKIVYLIK